MLTSDGSGDANAPFASAPILTLLESRDASQEPAALYAPAFNSKAPYLNKR
jgi:hypothetical protein